MNTSTIIPITELRRRFGEITANLAHVGSLILTKDGKPFAILKPAPEVKRNVLKKSAGAWKNTKLDSDKFWGEVLKKKSRKKAIRIS